MKRRDLLRSVGMLPILAGRFGADLGLAHATNAAVLRSNRRIRPSDPSWPSAMSWAKLKDEVGGNLIEVHSLFGSCQPNPNGAACLDALKGISNPYWIGDQPAGTEVSGWLDAWSPAPSTYAINARHVADVATGITFARTNNLRLVVKGGAHNYQGTLARVDTFEPSQCAFPKLSLSRKKTDGMPPNPDTVFSGMLTNDGAINPVKPRFHIKSVNRLPSAWCRRCEGTSSSGNASWVTTEGSAVRVRKQAVS